MSRSERKLKAAAATVFTVVRLPDDPRLSAGATRRRQGQSGAWKRKTFTPRSVTKNHQHHLLTDAPLISD